MYERITGENPTKVPMRIYPASHYTMGGLWVDYELMTTVPGSVLRRRGQLQRSRRQPPRRLGADAGPGRRLLRAAVHHRQLPRADAQQADPRHRPSRVQGGRGRRRAALPGLPRHQGHPLARLVPPRARQDHLGLLRHGAHRAGSREGAVRAARAVRRVPEGPARHRRRRRRRTRRWRRPAGSTTSSSSAC